MTFQKKITDLCHQGGRYLSPWPKWRHCIFFINFCPISSNKCPNFWPYYKYSRIPVYFSLIKWAGVPPPPPPVTKVYNVFLEGHRVKNAPLVATSYTLRRFWPKGRKKYFLSILSIFALYLIINGLIFGILKFLFQLNVFIGYI